MPAACILKNELFLDSGENGYRRMGNRLPGNAHVPDLSRGKRSDRNAAA